MYKYICMAAQAWASSEPMAAPASRPRPVERRPRRLCAAAPAPAAPAAAGPDGGAITC